MLCGDAKKVGLPILSYFNLSSTWHITNDTGQDKPGSTR